MAIVRCQCGANVRVPDQAAGSFRCPRCRTELAVPVAAAPVGVAAGAPGISDSAPSTTSIATSSVCPICQTGIAAHEAAVNCPTCQTPHHQECWNEIGGCAIYGCESAHASGKPDEEQQATSAWGDVKTCPMCGEQIKAIAVKCRYCGMNFDTVDPLNAQDLRNRIAKEQGSKSMRGATITLFVLSVIGLLAPIMLIISLVWVLRNREALAKTGPAYLVLGYAAIILSGAFTLMMVLLLLLS
jgi:hypothetical protein